MPKHMPGSGDIPPEALGRMMQSGGKQPMQAAKPQSVIKIAANLENSLDAANSTITELQSQITELQHNATLQAASRPKASDRKVNWPITIGVNIVCSTAL